MRVGSDSVQRAIAAAKPIVEQLDNGAKLVLNHVDDAPAATIRIGTAHGSLQDPGDKLGLAHLAEHMMFETSGVRTASEIRVLRRELGGHSNGMTNQHRVWVEATVPTSEAGRGASLLTDMYARSSTDPALLGRQRTIVGRELQHNYGDRDKHAVMQLRHLLYGGPESVWSRWGIGTWSGVQRIGPDDQARWISDAITGANTVALVDGDLRKVPVDRLRDDLASLARGARQPDPRFDGFAPGGAWTAIPHDGRAPVAVNVAFPLAAGAPKAGAGATHAALVERLRMRLREQDALTYAIKPDTNLGPRGSGVIVRTVLDPRDVRAGVSAIAEEARSLAAGIPDDEMRVATSLVRSRAAVKGWPSASARAAAKFDALVNQGGSAGAKHAPRSTAEPASDQLDPEVVQAHARALLDPQQARWVLHGGIAGRERDVAAGLADAGVDAAEVPFPKAWLRDEFELTRAQVRASAGS